MVREGYIGNGDGQLGLSDKTTCLRSNNCRELSTATHISLQMVLELSALLLFDLGQPI